MKLNNLIGKLETQTSINSKEFIELKKRKKQVKRYFQVENINIVVEVISNTLIAYYLDTKDFSHYEIIQKNDLNDQLKTGHIQLIKI